MLRGNCGPDLKSQLLIFAIVSLFNLYVFFPAFFHMDRGDQATYLIEHAKTERLPDLLKASYSNARTRQIAAGDQQLFRPLLYSLLAIEIWAFRYDFFFWQMVNFFLHLGVLWQMLRILYLLRPGWLAGFFVLNFSVTFLSNELVIWHHMGGMLLLDILLLQAFYYFIRYLRSDQQIRKYLWGMIGTLFFAALTYEFGVICCLIFMGVLYVHRIFLMTRPMVFPRRAWLNSPGLLGLPVVIYLILSLGDFFLRHCPVPASAIPWKWKGAGAGIIFISEILGQGLFFPFTTHIFPGFRTVLVPLAGAMGHEPSFWEQLQMLLAASASNIFAAVNLIFIVCLLLTSFFLVFVVLRNRFLDPHGLRQSPESRAEQGQAWILVTLVLFLLTYVGVIINGRFLSPGGKMLIPMMLYHFYFVNLFLGMSGYAFFVLVSRGLRHQFKSAVLLLSVVLSLSALVNGYKSHVFSQEVADRFRPARDYLVALNRFVNQHKKEQSFSFVVCGSEVRYVLNFVDSWPGKKGEFLADGVGLYFSKYYSPEKPKYYLVYTQREGLQSFDDLDSAQKYMTRSARENQGRLQTKVFTRRI